MDEDVFVPPGAPEAPRDLPQLAAPWRVLGVLEHLGGVGALLFGGFVIVQAWTEPVQSESEAFGNHLAIVGGIVFAATGATLALLGLTLLKGYLWPQLLLVAALVLLSVFGLFL